MRTFDMRNLWVVLMFAVGLLAALPASSEAQFVLYDDFNARKLDPDKWVGTESFAVTGPVAILNPNTETLRKVRRDEVPTAQLQREGVLHLKLRTFGDGTSDTGSKHGRQGFFLPNPGPVTAMQAKVAVHDATFADCAANLETSRARAQMFGFFFNDGTSTGEADRTGNIGTGIQKQRGVTGDLIVAFTTRCTDALCALATTLSSYVFTTTWTTDVFDTLQLQWDAAGNQFNFVVNPGTPNEETASLAYTQDDTLPAVLDFKAPVRVSNSAANCADGRKEVVMEATFDDVQLNPEAIP